MNERWFIDNFFTIASRIYPDSLFIDDVGLSAAANDDYDTPYRFTGDLIEFDGRGRAHLWLFTHIHAEEMRSGQAIGRLFGYAQMFRMAARDALAARIEKAARRRRLDTQSARFRKAIQRLAGEFDSWNLVACGGRGCELAGRADNPLFHLYAPLSAMVAATPDVNTWQFYRTGTGFDLCSVWDFAACGHLSLTDKVAIYDGRAQAPSRGDDFDIASKRDLHLKRRKGFHPQGYDAYYADRSQILAR